jgi:predicted transcriptional regulator
MKWFQRNYLYDCVLLKKECRGIIIKDATINVIDETDLEFIEGLHGLGVNRNVARLITYLKDVEEGSSRDIEMATGLRQPEISIATRTLRDMGWISEHEIKSPGKGRPQKIYALCMTMEEIIKHFEAEKNQESARTIEAIQKLKELSST